MRVEQFSPATDLYDVLKKGGQTVAINRIDRTGKTCAEPMPIDPGAGKLPLKKDLHLIWGKPVRGS